MAADDDEKPPQFRRRKWVPNVKDLADELVRDYRTGEDAELGQGVLDINRTLDSWQEMAKVHGDEFNEEDWGALVLELVRRVALLERGLRPEEWS
jgi:hypothetical protein